MSASERATLSFRAKLVLALLAAVVPVLVAALLLVRRETDRQIDRALSRTLRDSRDLFQRVEELRHQQLRELGGRFAASNRFPSALQQAIEGDTAFLASQIDYELGLASARDALVAFVDLDGNALVAIKGGRRLTDANAAVALPLLQKLVDGDRAAFGYHTVNGQLYSVHPVVMQIVSQPVGFLQLGFPIDQRVAEDIGTALGSEICFAVADHCAASTWGQTPPPLPAGFLATGQAAQRRIKVDDYSYAVMSTPLSGINGSIVVWLQLDQVLEPFQRIQQKLVIVGLAALVFAIALALALGGGLARPVRALVRATERVAQGDYDTRVEVKSRDELGVLAQAFNEMTHGLLLRDKYKGVLDKVVSRDIADELVKGEIMLGGETREVSVLFADIRGFTSLTEGMEPQRVIGLLNNVMEQLSAAVDAEGGVVDKYVGDELMALFGAPMSQPDGALRAVRSALRMQAEIARMNAQRATAGLQRVRVGIGINTGPVVAGNMGSQKRLNYTVVGEAVNLAARLCSAAEPGQVLISESTLRRAGPDISATPLGDRALKGFSSSIAIFEAHSAHAVPAGG
jgi:class 3 adenylate cyclase